MQHHLICEVSPPFPEQSFFICIFVGKSSGCIWCLFVLVCNPQSNSSTSWFLRQQRFRIAQLVSHPVGPCALSLCVPLNWIVSHRIELCCSELNCVVQLLRKIVSDVLFVCHRLSLYSTIITSQRKGNTFTLNNEILPLNFAHWLLAEET